MRNWQQDASRRAVLAVGAVGVAGALTGCAVYGRPEAVPVAAPTTVPTETPEPAPETEEPAAGEAERSEDGGGYGDDDPPADEDTGGGTRVARTGDVAVGGGYISTEHSVVVTQPASGQFRAFSAICTHAGCPVSSISDGTINCACHGSRFSIEDGSVRGGPAPSPLSEVPVTVNGDAIEI